MNCINWVNSGQETIYFCLSNAFLSSSVVIKPSRSVSICLKRTPIFSISFPVIWEAMQDTAKVFNYVTAMGTFEYLEKLRILPKFSFKSVLSSSIDIQGCWYIWSMVNLVFSGWRIFPIKSFRVELTFFIYGTELQLIYSRKYKSLSWPIPIFYDHSLHRKEAPRWPECIVWLPKTKYHSFNRNLLSRCQVKCSKTK